MIFQIAGYNCSEIHISQAQLTIFFSKNTREGEILLSDISLRS